MPTLSPNERLGKIVGGRYEIRRLLGEGGFSAVFEAVHTFTGREVALKILHGHLTTTEQITERFLMEARAMARINHDSIVQVLDAGRDPDGSVFIALELLDGESLEATLLRVGRLTWGESVSICIDVLGALSEAHRHKIIHRDIKPGNIFIVRKNDGSSQAKLLDFGIAHVAQAKNKLTAQGMILGTPEYMSPEQGRTANVGPESDLWSVGIVMWECLTGHTPFVAETATEILLKIATTDAPPILDEVPELPPTIAAVIDRSLARDTTQRYRTADEMREAMQRAMRKIDEASAAAAVRATNSARTPTSTSPGRRDTQEPPRSLPTSRLGDAPRKPSGVSSGGAPLRVEAPRRMADAPAANDTPQRIPAPLAPTPAEVQPLPVVTSGGTPVARFGGAVVEVLASDGKRPSGDRRVDNVAVAQAQEPGPVATRPNARSGVLAVGSTEREPVSSPAILPPEARAAQVVVSAVPASSGSPLPPLTPTPVTNDVAPLKAPTKPTPGASVSKPTPGSAPRPEGLSFEERESRTFSGRKTTFQKPPETTRVSWPLAGVLVLSAGLVGIGVFLSLRETPRPQRPHPQPPQHTADAAPPPPPPPPPPPEAVVPELALSSTNDVGLPQGLAGVDNATEFARHAAASLHAGTTQRMIATCIPSQEGGAALYLHPMTPGALRGSSQGLVACAGYDLGLVPDVTNDGSDDVVAIGARRGRLLVLDSRTLQTHRTIELDGVRGIAVGGYTVVRGEPVVVAFVEPRGAGDVTEVVAVSALSSRVLWRARGAGEAGRLGQPVEYGLAVGRDADGDNVDDVVAGMGPVLAAQGGARRRCAQLFSGADGHPLWPQPYCQSSTGAAQSVALGPDVNGDGRGDVVVGTNVPAQGEAPVVLLSGADGTVLRQWNAPPGELSGGFGWPVALTGDMNGNGTPDLVVGSVGAATGVTVFDTSTGQAIGRLMLGGVGPGNLRVFGVPPLVQGQAWSLMVANPADGLHVYQPTTAEEPL